VTKAVEKCCVRLTPSADAERDKAHSMLLHYVVTRRGANGPELLNVTLESGEEALPVFSSKGAANDFMLSSDLGREWYTRKSSPASWSLCFSGSTRLPNGCCSTLFPR
jgi:hypothetical protein